MKQFHRMLLVLVSVLAFSATFVVCAPVTVLAASQSTLVSSCPATISSGSRGSSVKNLQQTLNDFGFRDQNGKVLVIDGIFGSQTLFAVKNFQSIYAPPADGIVGFAPKR